MLIMMCCFIMVKILQIQKHLGVPYQEEVVSGNITRESTQGLQTNLIDDLNTANSLLSDGFGDRFSVTEDFVSFLKARLALITEDWPGVITILMDLINIH